MKRTIFAALLGTTALMPALAMAQAAPPAGQNAPAGEQVRPIAASQIKGKDVYTARGEEMGEVERVVLGQGDQAYAVVKFGGFLGLGEESRIIPLSNMALREDRVIVRGMQNADYRNLPVYRANMAGYRDAEPNYQARLIVIAANASNQTQADGSRILVQQTAPQVRVDQAAPQVTVQQPQPNVTVNQAQPQITVRQPQPTVTVDIPQPEIIVRMPQPDVNVAMAQPQVQVRQPQPQVQVMQPQAQPQVQVQRDQAQVTVRPAEGQPNVQVMRRAGEPEVRYERAEPRVVVNQAQGQPNVRFERVEGQPERQAQAQAQPAGQGDPNQARALRERINGGEVEVTGAVNAAGAQTRPIAVRQLEDMDVYNARGESLGEVDRVIVDAGNRQFLVIGSGGFLGLGRERVAFPMDRFWMRGDRLVIRGVTEQDIEAMDDYRSQFDSMRRLGAADQANLRVFQ